MIVQLATVLSTCGKKMHQLIFFFLQFKIHSLISSFIFVWQNDREVMLGTLLALIYAHRHCQVVDREAVTQLDAKLKEERKKATEMVRCLIICLQHYL